MANPMDVLQQLQIKLNANQMLKNIQVNVEEEDLDEDIGQNSTAGMASTNVSASDGMDVDNAKDLDNTYTTYKYIPLGNEDEPDERRIEIESILGEQDIDPEEQAPPDTDTEEDVNVNVNEPEAAPGADVEVPEGDMGGEMPGGEVPGGEDMGMGGMEEEVKSASEIGRIYELKKIYTRLTTIESYLSDSSDPDLLRIRLLVSKSIELFEILSANIPSYQPPKAPKERIDEIIVMYYRFLKRVYESVAKHYKEQNNKMNSNNITKASIAISNKELV